MVDLISILLYRPVITTTTVSWPLYRTACVSQQLQLRTGAKCYCLHALGGGKQHFQIRGETLEFSLLVLPACVHTSLLYKN